MSDDVPEALRQWQQIDTAPKDGTGVLIASIKHGIRVARYQPWAWNPGLHWFIGLEPGICGGTYAADATHWMPLPDLPKPPCMHPHAKVWFYRDDDTYMRCEDCGSRWSVPIE